MKKGIIGKMDGFSPGSQGPLWNSRDFEMTIRCTNRDCFLHGNSGQCVSPSIVSIDNTGRCEMYQKELNDRKNRKREESNNGV